MARTALDYNITTRTARSRLAPRPKPYYRQIGPGLTLGYIRREGTAGAWQSRTKNGGGYRYHTLGQADDVCQADDRDVLTFQQALRRITHPRASTSGGKITIAGALEAYFSALAGRSKHADEYRGYANKHIIPGLGSFRVDRITKTQIENWLTGLVRDDPNDPDAKRRSQDSANRILTILKAALNAAFQDDANKIESDSAWRRVKPFQKVARAREDDLDPQQVRRLIAAAEKLDKALARIIEAGYLTGARMGELAAASVRDLKAPQRTLYLDGKTGPRVVTLTEESAQFLQRLAEGRPADAPLLPHSNGQRWPRSGHHRLIKRALELAKLPKSASFYTLRHSHISRAIEAGMPLSLIAENCGTSLAMIQKHYAHVLSRARNGIVDKTAPRLRRVK